MNFTLSLVEKSILNTRLDKNNCQTNVKVNGKTKGQMSGQNMPATKVVH